MMEVPVPDLLQISHPGYALVMGRPSLFDENILVLVDFAKCLTERFEHYGKVDVSAPDIFELLQQSFKLLLSNDDPQQVIPVRFFTARLLEEFERMVSNMCQAFPINPIIKTVYNDLSELLFESLTELSGGEL
jgi:hypothetical protein